jgi:holin-like protein
MTLGNILLLLAFQIAGEFLHRVMHVPLSEPLLGMALLLLALILWGGPSPGLQGTTRPLLASLALLFVPAGVGVIGYLDLLAQHWLPILAATLGGVVASLLATAGTMRLVERLTRSHGEGNDLPAREDAPSLPAPVHALDGARP